MLFQFYLSYFLFPNLVEFSFKGKALKRAKNNETTLNLMFFYFMKPLSQQLC